MRPTHASYLYLSLSVPEQCSMADDADESLEPLKPVFDPLAGKWRVSRTRRPEDGRYSFESESDAWDWIERATGRLVS
jgi:hypothetical protein